MTTANRRLTFTLAFLGSICAAFIYGMAVIKFRVFPYKELQSLYADPAPSPWLGFKREFFRLFPQKADVVMFGDSITQNADWAAVFPNASIANQGVAGDTAERAYDRLGILKDTGAKKVFLMFGLNEIAAGEDAEAVFDHYKALVEQVTPFAHAYVQSTLLSGKLELNGEITKLNDRLRTYCQPPACTFIDLNTSIAPSGILDPAVSFDIYHLNERGYALWRDRIAGLIARSEAAQE